MLGGHTRRWWLDNVELSTAVLSHYSIDSGPGVGWSLGVDLTALLSGKGIEKTSQTGESLGLLHLC